MKQPSPNRPAILAVESPFHRERVVLAHETWQRHIEPFKSQQGVTVAGIQMTISQADATYRDKRWDLRHVMTSKQVVNDNGHQLLVFVEAKTPGYEANEVVTAFYCRSPKLGALVWSSESGGVPAVASYDDTNDVMYIATTPVSSIEDEEVAEGLYIGYSKSDKPVDATIMGMRSLDAATRAEYREKLRQL
ncbi:MAG: DUF2283 domain-containing protein [Rhodospirillales bacterium]